MRLKHWMGTCVVALFVVSISSVASAQVTSLVCQVHLALGGVSQVNNPPPFSTRIVATDKTIVNLALGNPPGAVLPPGRVLALLARNDGQSSLVVYDRVSGAVGAEIGLIQTESVKTSVIREQLALLLNVENAGSDTNRLVDGNLMFLGTARTTPSGAVVNANGTVAGWLDVVVNSSSTVQSVFSTGTFDITSQIGTVVGGPFALQFDGTNSWVSVPGDNALACNPITIEFWLKGTGDGADHQVMGNIPGFAQQGGWDFDVYKTWIGRALFYSYDSNGWWGGVAGPTYDQVFDGQWHHFALIADGAVWHMYFDGVLADAYTENMRTILPTTYNLTIGHRAWTSAPVLPGLVVDDLRISRVVRYTNSFIPPKTLTVDPHTVVYWKFNEGGGTTVSDSSGNNHTAVLCGSPLPAWVPGVKQ